jgi:hypothetical protein
MQSKLLDIFPSADLASHSRALTPYELPYINTIRLASFK